MAMRDRALVGVIQAIRLQMSTRAVLIPELTHKYNPSCHLRAEDVPGPWDARGCMIISVDGDGSEAGPDK
ncbi:hypothetical protein JMJ77_0000068 [Colletotrichum scovillei]|uniref:Uncharacterized protein n=1 Tax=Colletotrichum scovillei TaxID=1209932 RepID=A0A9P7UDS7_9PEZI|nr:hypothetical protein JMJ77_0000068 [Colletotrichum scovillei]KAG7071266.1 hypothetical protein JMJ76_0004140 [Colletotrichum scovillei]KAG7079491.1 hypothetical protein JMJ78_0006599 [Colletotrichum scovillei]